MYAEQTTDTESLQDDLVSLRKLYRLLQNRSGDGNQSSEAVLDEGSCRLLKRLLDSTTEKLFETHLKVLASSWRSLISVPHYTVQLEAAKQVPVSRAPSVSPYSCNNDQRGFKNRALPSKALGEDAPTTSSVFGHSDTLSTSIIGPKNFPTESQNQRKRCLACEQKGSSRRDFFSTTSPRYAAPHGKIQPEGQDSHPGGDWKQKIHLHGQLGIGSKSSSRGDIAVKGKQDSSLHAHDLFSREVDAAVMRIESLIPLTQRLTRRHSPPPPPHEDAAESSSNQEFHSFSGSSTNKSLDGVSINHPVEGVVSDGLVVAKCGQDNPIGRFSEQKEAKQQTWDKRRMSHLDYYIHRMQHDENNYQKKARVMQHLDPVSASSSTPFGSETFKDPHRRTDAVSNNKSDGDLRKTPKGNHLSRYNKNMFHRLHGERCRRSKSSWASQKEPESSSSFLTSNSRAASSSTTTITTSEASTTFTSAFWTEEAQSMTSSFSTDNQDEESQQGISYPGRLNAAGSGESSSEYTASYSGSSQERDDDDFDDGYHENDEVVVPSRPHRGTDRFRSKYRDRVKHEGRFQRLKNKLGLILHHRHRHRGHDGCKVNDAYCSKVAKKQRNVRTLWKQLGKMMFRHVERNDTFPVTKAKTKKAKKSKGKDLNAAALSKGSVTRKGRAGGDFSSLVNGLISHMRRTKKAKAKAKAKAAAAKDGRMIARLGARGGGKTMKNTTRRMDIGGRRKGKGGVTLPGGMVNIKPRGNNTTTQFLR